MNFIYLSLFIFIFSCGYPDIDTVPDFNDTNITKEESIDLCNLANTDKDLISKCIKNINED